VRESERELERVRESATYVLYYIKHITQTRRFSSRMIKSRSAKSRGGGNSGSGSGSGSEKQREEKKGEPQVASISR
jgi:hypothetical protein